MEPDGAWQADARLSETTHRTQNDAFALAMYRNAEIQDRKVVDVVARIAEARGVPRAHVALAWLLAKPGITAPIVGATKPEHLATAIGALDFALTQDEIAALEAPYVPHLVDGIVPPLPDHPPTISSPRH